MSFLVSLGIASCLSCVFSSSGELLTSPNPLGNPLKGDVFSAIARPVDRRRERHNRLQLKKRKRRQLIRRTGDRVKLLAQQRSRSLFQGNSQGLGVRQTSAKPQANPSSDRGICSFSTADSRAGRDRANPWYEGKPSRSRTTIEPMSRSPLVQHVFERLIDPHRGWIEPVWSPRRPVEAIVVSADEVEIEDMVVIWGDRPNALQTVSWIPEVRKPGARPSRPSSVKTPFQVWVNGYLIAKFPDRLRAEMFAQRIEELIDVPEDAAKLEPTLVRGLPAARIGDLYLFAIDPDLASHFKRHRDLVAIEWIDNLRLALGAPRLSISQAQAQMYGLVETSQKLRGTASWYGPYFHGRLTATGEIFDQNELTAAHKTLPFDTYLKVKNLQTGSEVIVRINDRGPYIPPRSLDLALGAARSIGSEEAGVVPYEATIMKPGQKVVALSGD
ncbi:septal ring lytic transglycosylase RlpA family protein [Oxynema aestuarii]|jgi:hypothetical protein|uniref:Probable endolytic peptidoglycan transglycosylase RlpA n=1 Tax=Oxynema aestuarii AP17 TaxID=2064643 RepID=A0A6H1U3B8_9CYAN|nr:septal ring lytic transglycosylase RlpA family protein [Oxynema aestuarii]QIZ73378.1 septal ring lytic transglycosylase RlpA family protein [Oxynema aestuarii AP17]